LSKQQIKQYYPFAAAVAVIGVIIVIVVVLRQAGMIRIPEGNNTNETPYSSSHTGQSESGLPEETSLSPVQTTQTEQVTESTKDPGQERAESEALASQLAEQRRLERKKQHEILKESLTEYISGFPGTYGIYYINLATGNEFGINDTQEYRAASTSKLPINLYLYRKIEEGTVDPEQLLTYKREDFEAGTGIIQNEPYGTEYTVRETSKLSIEISDNCGINMIIRLLGIENIRQYMLDIGGSIYYGAKYRTCPKDMACYMKELYDFYLGNPDVAGELMGYLENTIFNDRIPALLPEDIRVAHKIGNQPTAMNDVGIVFTDEPYIISVFSDEVEPGPACDVIANISKMVFDFVQENSQ
jgi:beta-lactamase class A